LIKDEYKENIEKKNPKKDVFKKKNEILLKCSLIEATGT